MGPYEPYGSMWAHMSPYGPYMDPYEPIWAHMDHGLIWAHGPGPMGRWAHMGPYGSIWIVIEVSEAYEYHIHEDPEAYENHILEHSEAFNSIYILVNIKGHISLYQYIYIYIHIPSLLSLNRGN